MSAWQAKLAAHKRVALDTNAVIYFLDRTEPYFAYVEAVFERTEKGLMQIVIPVLVEMELLVGPLRKHDAAAVQATRLLMDHFPGLTVAPVDHSAARAAARLRATHGLSTPDALIAGTALVAGCTAIIGNDRLCATRLTHPVYLPLFQFLDSPSS